MFLCCSCKGRSGNRHFNGILAILKEVTPPAYTSMSIHLDEGIISLDNRRYSKLVRHLVAVWKTTIAVRYQRSSSQATSRGSSSSSSSIYFQFQYQMTYT